MRSIRWKLALAFFVVVFLPVYFLNNYAITSFDEFTRQAKEEEMIGLGVMLSEQYKAKIIGRTGDALVRGEREFREMLTRHAQQVDPRLQILSTQGIVLFDSDADSLVGTDFSDRGEISNAMNGGPYQAAWRITGDRKWVFYYVPRQITHDGELVAIAYVTHHTGRITGAIKRMIRDQRIALALSLAFALLMAVVLAQTMTRRLRKLTQAARDYATGSAPLEIQAKGVDEIAALGKAITHMAAATEKRNEYNRQFVSTVLHELRTPVTAIKGAAEVLEGGAFEKDDVRAKFLANIRYEADRLTRMVGELRGLTELDVQALTGQKEEVDYGRCVTAILDRIMPTFDQEHARFNCTLPEEQMHVMIVPDTIEQVISNLLENAFRYTPVDGQVELMVALTEDGQVLTTIRDDGAGIAPTSLGRVFDRFYTTEVKGVAKEYGSGLGLAVAKSIIENHQGRIWVESEPGAGACFSFTLAVA